MILDIVIVSILLISAIVAFFRGFIKEVLTIVGLGGAAVGAIFFGGMAVPLFESWIVNPDDKDYKMFWGFVPDDVVAMMAAYASIFAVIFILLTVLGHFLSKGAQALGLGPVDRSLGVLFGLFRGVVLAGILYMPFSFLMSGGEYPQFVQESKLIPVLDKTVTWTAEALNFGELMHDSDDKAADEKAADDEKNETGRMIDKVRDEYIGDADSGGNDDAPRHAPEDAPAKNGPDSGYDSGEREALDSLIRKGSLNE